MPVRAKLLPVLNSVSVLIVLIRARQHSRRLLQRTTAWRTIELFDYSLPLLGGGIPQTEFLCDEVYAVLQRHRAALRIHDMISEHPRVLTADWTYLRYHGERYTGSYSAQQLTAEAKWMKARLASGTDVFAYFNNDAQGFAVKNAADLGRYTTG